MPRLKPDGISRRNFFTRTGCGAVALSTTGTVLTSTVLRADDRPVDASGRVIAGFENNEHETLAEGGWRPFSDRQIRVGIAGFGLCKFGAQFGFQDHPNVEVSAAVSYTHLRAHET